MASAGVKAELTCSICMGIYSDPVYLPCGHNFCKKCITKTWEHQDEEEYTCPECVKRYKRRVSLKKNRKLQNIADAFLLTHKESEDTGTRCSFCLHIYVPAIKSCLHCEASLCDNHLITHSRSPEHIIIEPSPYLVNKKCPVHKKILEYYCKEDDCCICNICRINRKHREHQVMAVMEAAKKKKKKCKQIQKKLAKKHDETEKRLQGLLREKEKVTKRAAAETERVTVLFRDIRDHLDDLEKKVLSVVSTWEEKALLPVSGLIQRLETNRDEFSRRMGHIQELCHMKDPINVLQEKESGEDSFTDVGGNEEKAEESPHPVEELDQTLISLQIHRDLADIMRAVKRRLHDDGAVG
ncbi:E3 ubiquitin-protein ligase TRIM47-like [Phyllobates terribilis]|uniref:E3 ubiquitin-protein ligase TRIM47-like n=1 Tax=Phyllobates terribilis TaxID=111132 RepID=UPI003CCB01A4